MVADDPIRPGALRQRRLIGRVRGLIQDRGGLILGQARQETIIGAHHLLRRGVARGRQLFLRFPRLGIGHGDAISSHAAVKEGHAKRQENALPGPIDMRIRAAAGGVQ